MNGGGRRIGPRHPGLASWRAKAVEALVTLSETPEAQRLAREQRELSEQLGTPGARGAALSPVPGPDQAVAAGVLVQL